MAQIMGVYALTCSVTERVYIGSSTHVKARWSQHTFDLRRGNHPVADMQADWTACGESSFTFEIVEPVLMREVLIDRERWWIANQENPYNKSLNGTMRGYKHGPEMTVARLATRARFLETEEGLRYRAHMSRLATKRFQDPQQVADMAARVKDALSKPEWKEAQSQRMKACFNKPGERERRRAFMLERHANMDESERERARARLRAVYDDPAQRQRVSDTTLARTRAAKASVGSVEDILTQSEAACILGCCTDRLIRHVKQGKLPATRVGRYVLIFRKDLENYANL